MALLNEPKGLYLIAEVADGADAAARLRAALTAAPAQAVLLVPAAGEVLTAERTRAALEYAQRAGVAVLIEDDANLARTLRADGVHLTWSRDPLRRYREAREIMGGNAIVGADAGCSRHDAMTLGEAGADYIAFAARPDDGAGAGTADARRLDLCEWWSALFEIPCVAFDLSEADQVRALAEAGADFLAFRLPASEPLPAMAARLATIQAALTTGEHVT